jgi:predicted secreted protein
VTLVTGIAVFFVIWWLCLFVVLPFGIRSQHEAGEITHGTEPGAPEHPALLWRVTVTTLLAAVIFAGFYLYFNIYDLTLAELMP